MTRYEIAKQFSEGFCAAILPAARDPNKSNHWLAGWDAGYKYRAERTKLLNEYMVSIGSEPFAKVRLAGAD